MSKTSNLAPEQEIEVLRRGLKDADAECWKLRQELRTALERTDAAAARVTSVEAAQFRAQASHIAAGRRWDEEKGRLMRRIDELTISQVPAPDTEAHAQIDYLKRELAEQRQLADGLATVLRARNFDRDAELDELTHMQVKLMGWRLAAIGAGVLVVIGILLEV